MIVQNNNKPVVVLALVVMTLCGILGVLLGLNPFGPGQAVRAEEARTQLAISIPATQAALGAIQTPQAIYANQTAVAAELTSVPIYQTATAVAGNAANANAQAFATQTALEAAGQAEKESFQATQTYLSQQQALNALAFNATATAFVQGPITNTNHENIVLILIGIGTLAISIGIVASAVNRTLKARTQAKMANAHLLAEQRRLLSARASIKEHSKNINAHNENFQMKNTIPISLIKKPGNGQGTPHVG
jgi:hypothetical protein